jgi:hypothetical protein
LKKRGISAGNPAKGVDKLPLLYNLISDDDRPWFTKRCLIK